MARRIDRRPPKLSTGWHVPPPDVISSKRYAEVMKSFGSLNNYIEMHRLRGGLTQAELSYLISVESGSSVSRYERGLRFPNLEAIVALELVLGRPVQELYAGVAERVRDDVAERARALLSQVGDEPTKEIALKLELLGRLARPDEEVVIPVWPEE